MSTVTPEVSTARARHVIVSDTTLSVDLQDGRTLSIPLIWYPRLVAGTSQERTHWRLIAAGVGIHWPDLDEDIKVEHLLLGRASNESEASLRRWLEQRATARR